MEENFNFLAIFRKLDRGPKKTVLDSVHSQFSGTKKITEQQGKEKFDIEGGVVLMTSKYLVKKVNRKKSADRNKIERLGNW